jgi:hypothetical protein
MISPPFMTTTFAGIGVSSSDSARIEAAGSGSLFYLRPSRDVPLSPSALAFAAKASRSTISRDVSVTRMYPFLQSLLLCHTVK